MSHQDHFANAPSCFSVLSNTQLNIIQDKKAQVSYLKGENIIKHNAPATHVIYVISGLVRVYLQSEGQSKQANLRLAKSGDFMAFSSVFGKSTYPYSAIAMTDTLVCMVDKEALKEVLMDNPDFGMLITTRNYQLEQRYLDIISNLSFNQMRGKLASALLYLSSDEFEKEDVFLNFTRQDIADFASITVESAIKFIKEFEKEKIIQIINKNIEIISTEKLQLLSKKG